MRPVELLLTATLRRAAALRDLARRLDRIDLATAVRIAADDGTWRGASAERFVAEAANQQRLVDRHVADLLALAHRLEAAADGLAAG